jgi:hypothetical protein
MRKYHLHGLAHLARLARSRQTRLAGLLARYQAQEELDDAGLGAFLEADAQALTPCRSAAARAWMPTGFMRISSRLRPMPR